MKCPYLYYILYSYCTLYISDDAPAHTNKPDYSFHSIHSLGSINTHIYLKIEAQIDRIVGVSHKGRKYRVYPSQGHIYKRKKKETVVGEVNGKRMHYVMSWDGT